MTREQKAAQQKAYDELWALLRKSDSELLLKYIVHLHGLVFVPPTEALDQFHELRGLFRMERAEAASKEADAERNAAYAELAKTTKLAKRAELLATVERADRKWNRAQKEWQRGLDEAYPKPAPQEELKPASTEPDEEYLGEADPNG